MTPTAAPLGTLTYHYLGSADFASDLACHWDVIGAQKVWHFEHFGARVAAFRVGEGPPVLRADHRPAPSCLLVFGGYAKPPTLVKRVPQPPDHRWARAATA